MTKTIKEAAKEYSADANVTSENFCAEDITDAFENGANYIMSLPLASRLTAEEKERVRRIHMEYKWLYAKHKDSVFRWAEVYKGKYELLESIFGADFFKEGE
jgi:hypothetical protein